MITHEQAQREILQKIFPNRRFSTTFYIHYKREMRDFEMIDLVCIYHNVIALDIKQGDFETLEHEQDLLCILISIFHRISKTLFF